MAILFIIMLVLLLLIIVICYIAYLTIRARVRRLSTSLFGTSSVLEGISKVEQEYASTPKSVSSGTSMYLPRINKDFPEWNYEEMRTRAQNVLVSYLRALDLGQNTLLTEGTHELRDKLEMQTQMLKAKNIRVHYDSIRIHATEINRYRKEKGRCSITFQSAVEYFYYAESGGVVTQGRKTSKTQAKYNIEMIYIQDRDLVEDTRDMGLGLNCPNCNGPLTSIGAKICPYCDTPVIEFNIRIWNFSDVTEIR